MLAPQTMGDLADRLTGEIGWRKKEISAFRTAAARASSSQTYYCRAGSVMLCAHWEGFLRVSIQTYVDYVFSQSLRLKDLAIPFVAIYFFKEVVTAGMAHFPGSDRQHIKLAKKIEASLEGSCNRPSWTVDTEGSPGSVVTSNILASVGLDRMMGLDETEWSVQRVFIDTQLLKDRHKVAHGERYPISQSDFRKRANRVIGMCESILNLILDAAESRAYLKDVVSCQDLP